MSPESGVLASWLRALRIAVARDSAPAFEEAEMPAARHLEAQLGYRFRHDELLARALTHRSWANERGGGENFERLEFLGDSVLGLVTAEWLFERHPELPEGELSRRRSILVSTPVLAALGEELGVGQAVRLGVGEERSGGRGKPSILADATEALLGGIFVEGGLAAARRVVRRLLDRGEAVALDLPSPDSKTRLQERVQATVGELPEYRLVAEEGPDHEKRFTVECSVGGRCVGRATDRSKKLAEQSAAAQALAALDDAGDGA